MSAAALRMPLRELVAFGVVGTAAAVVHFAVVVALVPLGIPPLGANVAGFLTAFLVSFAGHDRWSFPSERRARAPAARRFFVVAASGFAANELLYWALLTRTSLSYATALLIVLAAVSGATLLLAKLWAFRDAPR